MKCAICKNKLEENFLNKPLGAAVKNEKGKTFWVCKNCQRGKEKKELLAAMK
jgi:hypothetical protein